MFETRQPATATAETLRREHRATIGTATSALRTAGYEAREVVSAITSSFGASQSAVYAAMKEAGFPPATISGGFSSAGVQLGCIDPQGYAIPCGNFGGQSDVPVMGQLTWSPQAEGPTDGQLTITGTNIPLLTVRIGMNVLTQLSASSSAVVVRLPSSTMTGDLTVRRTIDQAVGTLVAGFRVVQPPVPWATYGAAALAGAIEDAKYWIGGAKIDVMRCVGQWPDRRRDARCALEPDGLRGEGEGPSARRRRSPGRGQRVGFGVPRGVDPVGHSGHDPRTAMVSDVCLHR